MMQRDYILILHDTLKDLDESRHWLKRSYDICKAIGIKDLYSEDEFDIKISAIHPFLLAELNKYHPQPQLEEL